MKLKIRPDLVEFPVGENIPSRLGNLYRDKSFKGKWDVIILQHQTRIPEVRQGKSEEFRWVSLNDIIFLPDTKFNMILRKLYGIANILGVDLDELEIVETINNSGGNITKELFDKFLVEYLSEIKSSQFNRTDKESYQYFLKTRIKDWKGTAVTNVCNNRYISLEPDMFYLEDEDKFNNHIYKEGNYKNNQ